MDRAAVEFPAFLFINGLIYRNSNTTPTDRTITDCENFKGTLFIRGIYDMISRRDMIFSITISRRLKISFFYSSDRMYIFFSSIQQFHRDVYM